MGVERGGGDQLEMFLSSLRCEEYEESAREEIPIWSLQSDLRVTQAQDPNPSSSRRYKQTRT